MNAPSAPAPHFNAGFLYATGSYLLWGLFPFYWKLLVTVAPFEILTHRMLWSFVFVSGVCLLVRRGELIRLFKDRRALLILGAAGFIVAVNWGLYIVAINTGHVLQASLGYYINPLIAILFGVVIFKERLTHIQKTATVLAALGVLYFSISYGSFPWLSVGMAVSFALYGALKKKGGYPATPALAVESTLVLPLALVFVVVTFLLPSHAFLDVTNSAGLGYSWVTTTLLMGGGIVTAVPLLLFSKGANSIPLSWMGFLQYITPSMTLLLGVFVYGEPFTPAHVVCFSLIWAGLIMISIELFLGR
ncbi:MAG: EamA family transporter RarD [Coriobacteriales bacterium]|jgi:chloramphenicol-sensitive protein RarD|nr:EamA family transporter RarD [Coriobacteriales bacterium]